MTTAKIKAPKPFTEKFTAALGTPVSLFLHTVFFVVMFLLPFFGISFQDMMLALTTAVSIEAIYLALFIQMTVNRASESLEEVEESLEDVEESLEGVEEDLEGLEKNLGGIEKDIDGLEKDIDDIIEDDRDDDVHDKKVARMLSKIDARLNELHEEITRMKKG